LLANSYKTEKNKIKAWYHVEHSSAGAELYFRRLQLGLWLISCRAQLGRWWVIFGLTAARPLVVTKYSGFRCVEHSSVGQELNSLTLDKFSREW